MNHTSAKATLYSVLSTTVIAAVLLLSPGSAQSAVSGFCSNCHTMHNSQDGAMVYTGGPEGNLLNNDCVGCHTSTTAITIVSDTPIVFNIQEPTGVSPQETTPLAGGNFYWVVNDGDAYGHNVRGITTADVALSAGNPGGPNCVNSCHVSLTLSDADTDGYFNGCRGCHYQTKHHGTDPVAGQPETEASGWYRFLVPRSGHLSMYGGASVAGIEDADWEQSADANDHNIYYKGTGDDWEAPAGSLGKFCAGCHLVYHSPGFPSPGSGIDNGGGANPWLRHPTDYAIANAGEYSAVSTTYDPTVPVGKDLTDTGNFGNVVLGTDTVMCMSCHRAHGSPYPDMLRWDYTEMLTGTTGDGQGNGCFKCHTAKDG